ncbi:MAG: hypothetical protein ABWY36_02080 [Leifsonia sp.]
MKNLISKLASRLAPRTYENLQLLATVDVRTGETVAVMLARHQVEVRELRAEVNELRRDNRRVTELYDAVFERIRSDNPLV